MYQEADGPLHSLTVARTQASWCKHLGGLLLSKSDYAQWKKPVTEGQILHDSTYKKNLK